MCAANLQQVPQIPAVSELTAKISKAYLFSMIEAKGNNCNCDVCVAWRKVANELKTDLLADFKQT